MVLYKLSNISLEHSTLLSPFYYDTMKQKHVISTECTRIFINITFTQTNMIQLLIHRTYYYIRLMSAPGYNYHYYVYIILSSKIEFSNINKLLITLIRPNDSVISSNLGMVINNVN